MFTRAVQSLFIVTGQSLSKSKCSTRSFSGAIKLFPNCLSKHHNSNLTNFRPCTTFSPPDKDKISQDKLNELLKDPVIEKQYKVLQLEIDVMRQGGENVPSSIKPRYWFELLQLNSFTRRKKYLDFLFGIEMKKEHRLEKKKIKAEQKPPKPDESDVPWHLQYRLGGNSFFLRFYDTTIHHHYNWNLLREMMGGQKLVIDCGFEDKMTRLEVKNCAKQLQLSFAVNRSHDHPFDLHFCNLNKSEYLHQEFHSYIPTMYAPDFPINIHEISYLDLFDKDKLIYLTPDCTDEIHKFDHDAIYIIGGIVDKVNGIPLTMAKAKREGIRMAKLPLDRYLDFGNGSGKSLTINQMVAIIADFRATGDWEHSFQHVPRRKLFESRQHQAERRLNRILKDNQNENIFSANPGDYSIKARNKFRNKL